MKLKVGHPSIKWQSIPPGRDVWEAVHIKDGEEEVVGEVVETIEHFTDWRRNIRRIQELTSDVLGNRRTTSVVVANSFVPLFHESITDDDTLRVDYDGYTVKLTHNGEVSTHTLTDVVFDIHSVEMIVRLLNFDRHPAITIPVFRGASASEIDVELNAHRAVKGWTVEADFGGVRQVYYVSAGQIVTQETPLDDGSTIIFRP
jgi:hypothetical protein